MPQSNVITGRSIDFFIPDGGVERRVCYSRNVTITETAEIKEVFGKGLDGYRDFKLGKKTFTVELDGLLNAVQGGATAFIKALQNGSRVPFRMTDGINMEWSGNVLVYSNVISAPLDDLATFSTSLQGVRKLNFGILPAANTSSNGTTLAPVTPKGNNFIEPFSEEIIFTYDGTNNVQQLSFAPKYAGTAFMEGIHIDVHADYYYQSNNVVINKPLQQGIEYKLILYYYK